MLSDKIAPHQKGITENKLQHKLGVYLVSIKFSKFITKKFLVNTIQQVQLQHPCIRLPLQPVKAQQVLYQVKTKVQIKYMQGRNGKCKTALTSQ